MASTGNSHPLISLTEISVLMSLQISRGTSLACGLGNPLSNEGAQHLQHMCQTRDMSHMIDARLRAWQDNSAVVQQLKALTGRNVWGGLGTWNRRRRHSASKLEGFQSLRLRITSSYRGDSKDWKMAKLQMMVDMSLGSTAMRPSSIYTTTSSRCQSKTPQLIPLQGCPCRTNRQLHEPAHVRVIVHFEQFTTLCKLGHDFFVDVLKRQACFPPGACEKLGYFFSAPHCSFTAWCWLHDGA